MRRKVTRSAVDPAQGWRGPGMRREDTRSGVDPAQGWGGRGERRGLKWNRWRGTHQHPGKNTSPQQPMRTNGGRRRGHPDGAAPLTSLRPRRVKCDRFQKRTDLGALLGALFGPLFGPLSGPLSDHFSDHFWITFFQNLNFSCFLCFFLKNQFFCVFLKKKCPLLIG